MPHRRSVGQSHYFLNFLPHIRYAALSVSITEASVFAPVSGFGCEAATDAVLDPETGVLTAVTAAEELSDFVSVLPGS